ncbi:hypothetical protein Barb4_05524 [Bacteroidales bacterium Barb4]|nr:hypothetical protein Barb4_05524 [Bacteroidales bacterium Barb4]
MVVDGQQRLATTLLFLIALRDIEDDIIRKQQITDLYLKNKVTIYRFTVTAGTGRQIEKAPKKQRTSLPFFRGIRAAAVN